MRSRIFILSALISFAAMTASAVERDQVKAEGVKHPVAREISANTPTAETIAPSPSPSQAADLEVKWSVLAGGGKTVEAGDLRISGTIGQTAAGWSAGLNNDVHAGFWQNFEYTPCCEHRGNVDHKFTNESPISIADLTYLVAMLFRGGGDAPCMVEADVTGDGSINVADLTFLVAFLFRGGAAPGSC